VAQPLAKIANHAPAPGLMVVFVSQHAFPTNPGVGPSSRSARIASARELQVERSTMHAKFPAQTLALVVALCPLAGCASSAASGAPAPKTAFDNDEAKLLACLDLRDHIVDLYATQYVSQQGMVLTAAERTAFRDGWAEELAKKGTFERFERSCFVGLTPRKYECGMASKTPDGLVACMKLTAR
jgi:hypothetical protein